MTENNRRQAYVPEGASVIENPVGTAPAFVVEDTRGTIICLPGVPRELEYLMTRRVIPLLKERAGSAAVIKIKVLRTCAIGESQIDTLIGDLMVGGNPTVGLAAHSGQVDVRITAKAVDEAEADQLIASAESELRARLGNVIYGEGTEALGEVVVRLLAERDMTLALMDNATHGDVAERLGDTPQVRVLAAEEYPTGIVDTALERPQVMAENLAAQARADANASLGLAVFGANREGEDESPQAYLALSDGNQIVTHRHQFGGVDKLTRRWLSIRALDLVRRYLIGALDDALD